MPVLRIAAPAALLFAVLPVTAQARDGSGDGKNAQLSCVDYRLRLPVEPDTDRWLLPDIADTYGAPQEKPMLRFRGKKVKLRLPI